jgi:UDP-N-acetylmuramoyl-tripeptide--D-alanyl-D-alanine ligase
LITVGSWAAETARAARVAGLQETTECADIESAAQTVQRTVRPGDVVLIKASRAAGLDRVAAVLRGAVNSA